MNLDDLTPAGADSLRVPIAGPGGRTVAQFTVPPDLALDDIWHGRPDTRLTDATRDGSQGAPFGGYRPGHGLEHEPENKTERESFDLDAASGKIRAALRPGAY